MTVITMVYVKMECVTVLLNFLVKNANITNVLKIVLVMVTVSTENVNAMQVSLVKTVMLKYALLDVQVKENVNLLSAIVTKAGLV
jgi:hypothetical protein